MQSTQSYLNSGQGFELVKQFLEGEKGVRRFCRENNISTASLYYWRKKYDQIKNGISERPSSEGFIPIEIIQDTNFTGEKLEISFPNGVEMKLPLKTDPALLKSLITIF